MLKTTKMTFPAILIKYRLRPFKDEEEMIDYLINAEGDEEKRIRMAIRELNGWD